jgi:CheY-like chemotaxis protein
LLKQQRAHFEQASCKVKVAFMKRPLDGRIILIIEDEALIAFDLQSTFEDQGAQTISVQSVEAGLVAVEQPGLSAAVIDHALGDGDSSELCRRLSEREVPFITYSGNPQAFRSFGTPVADGSASSGRRC